VVLPALRRIRTFKSIHKVRKFVPMSSVVIHGHYLWYVTILFAVMSDEPYVFLFIWKLPNISVFLFLLYINLTITCSV